MKIKDGILTLSKRRIVIPELSGEETFFSSGIFGERMNPIEWFENKGLSHPSGPTKETHVLMCGLGMDVEEGTCFEKIFNSSDSNICFTQHQIVYLLKREIEPFNDERVIIRKFCNESSFFMLEGKVLLEIQHNDGHLRVSASKDYKRRKVERDDLLYSFFFFPVENILT